MLVHCTRLPMGLKTRIEESPDDQPFVEFTKRELEKLGDEVDASLVHVPHAHRKRLNVVLNKIGDLLADLVVKELNEIRQPVHESGAIYQLKVTLTESNPPIWRRIQVPDCTLGELHDFLQVIMGWEDNHLHQFIVNRRYFGEDTHDFDMEVEDEDGIRLTEIYMGKNPPGSSTSMTSETPGSMRSFLRKSSIASRSLLTPAASKGRERVRRRMWVASGDMQSFSKPSVTRFTKLTMTRRNGSAVSSTRRDLTLSQ